MKKLHLLFAVLCTILFSLSVSGQSFKKGQLDLNLDLGLGNNLAGPGLTLIPPISASLEYGITDDISLGGYLGFAGSVSKYNGSEWCNHGNGVNYNYTDSYTWTYILIGVRGAYHFGRFIKIDKLDVYAGLMLGNDFAHESYSTTSPCSDHIRYNDVPYGGFFWSLYGGARYRFTNRFGVFGELGYGVSYLNIGVNFKF
jgi:hypothetical protein